MLVSLYIFYISLSTVFISFYCSTTTPTEMVPIDKLYRILRDMNSIAVYLQRDYMKVSEVRALFDNVILQYLFTAKRIYIRCSIVVKQTFESSNVKVK